MNRKTIRSGIRTRALVASVLMATLGLCPAYSQSGAPSQSNDDTRQLLMELRDELRQTRSQLQSAQQQIEQLNGEVKSLRRDLAAAPNARRSEDENTYESPTDLSRQTKAEAQAGASSGDVEEQLSLLKSQVEEQHQTKVESASKYRVKLSGLVLFNAFSNSGGVNSIDVPAYAVPYSTSGSTGFTLRQTVLGLQVFGPQIAGAESGGSVTMDFFGGLPQQTYGASSGLVRLRTASFDLNWRNMSVTAGVVAPFFTPLAPTSYATVGEPALSQSGNLWTWTPQIVVEHRIRTGDESFFSVSGGLMDALTEGASYSNSFQTAWAIAGPGERGRRPAFAASAAWQSKMFGQTIRVGVGGYTSHLKYEFGRTTDAWAATSFWQVPLGSRLELSGELYRGRAVGGLGGGIWQSVVFNGDSTLASTELRPLNAVGGWSQLKVRLTPRWETNFAFGQDNVLAQDLRWAPVLTGEYVNPLARNRTAFGNVIYRPRSNLVLSAEYRNLRTYAYVGRASTAGQVNLAAGVSF